MIKNGIELTKCTFYPTMRGMDVGERWTYPIDGYRYVAECGEELVIHRDFATLMDEQKIKLLKDFGYRVSHLKSGFGVGIGLDRLKDVAEKIDQLNEVAVKCKSVRDYDKCCLEHDELVQKYRSEV